MPLRPLGLVGLLLIGLLYPFPGLAQTPRATIPVSVSMRTSASFERVADVLAEQARALDLQATMHGARDLRLEGTRATFDVFLSHGGGEPGYTHVMIDGRETVTRRETFQDVANTLANATIRALKEEADAWALVEPEQTRGSAWCWASGTPPERVLPALPDAYEEADVYPVLTEGMEAFTRQIDYPEAARRAGIGGRVFITFLVTEEGRPDCLHAARGLPGGLSEAALDAVERATFHPGERGGEPARVWITLPVTFRLR